MTEHVLLRVLVQVEKDEDADLILRQKHSVVEAVRNAIVLVEQMGFDHPCAGELSIGLVSVDLAPEG